MLCLWNGGGDGGARAGNARAGGLGVCRLGLIISQAHGLIVVIDCHLISCLQHLLVFCVRHLAHQVTHERVVASLLFGRFYEQLHLVLEVLCIY